MLSSGVWLAWSPLSTTEASDRIVARTGRDKNPESASTCSDRASSHANRPRELDDTAALATLGLLLLLLLLSMMRCESAAVAE